MPERCSRCGRFKKPDAILLCSVCAPPGTLRQDATVTPQTVMRRGTVGGAPPKPLPPQPPPKSKVKATAKRPGKKPLTAQQDRGKWNHDRQAYETRDMVIDRDDKYYKQEWTDPETGKKTFNKKGPLDDPTMHGKASHKPTTPTPPTKPRPPKKK